MVAAALAEDGFAIFPHDPALALWAQAARAAGLSVLNAQAERRHGKTWFVGVDALPNAADGSVNGVPLAGPWQSHVEKPAQWHRAQLSVVFPGYPKRDPEETEAAHRFRLNRDAAHVDGLLPEGPTKRRHLREPHGFILGLPLDGVVASPLVVWRQSHKVMRDAFRHAFQGSPADAWGDIDVTDHYQDARRKVFASCQRVEIVAQPGQAVLLDRHLLHGVAPWAGQHQAKMRMTAYFRPQVSPQDWL